MLEDEGLSINDLAPQRGIRCHSCELWGSGLGQWHVGYAETHQNFTAAKHQERL
jgi:hypothetical protein